MKVVDWYDDEKAMNYLAKYASAELIFEGEEGETWKWVADNGIAKKFVGEMQWS